MSETNVEKNKDRKEFMEEFHHFLNVQKKRFPPSVIAGCTIYTGIDILYEHFVEGISHDEKDSVVSKSIAHIQKAISEIYREDSASPNLPKEDPQ